MNGCFILSIEMHRDLDCHRFLGIIHKAFMDTIIQVFSGYLFSFLLSTYLGTEVVDDRVSTQLAL